MLYTYDPDPSRFAWLGHPGQKWPLIEMRDDPSSFVSKWDTIDLKRQDEGTHPIGDFPRFSLKQAPLMSPRAWSVLKPIIEDAGEPLPVRLPSGEEFFFIHIREIIEALDEDRSEIRRRSEGSRSPDDHRIGRVFKYKFHDDMIAGKHIFKLPNKQGGDLIIDEVFRQAVEDNGLEGLIFKPLPMVD